MSLSTSSHRAAAPILLRDDRHRLSRVAASNVTLVLVATAVLFAASAVISPSTISGGAVLSLLPFAATLAVVSMGQTLVIQQGGIDMSIPGVMSLSVVLQAVITGAVGDTPLGVVVAIIAALLVSIAVGVCNGIVVTRFGVAPIVVTIGINAVLFGAIWAITNGSAQNSPLTLMNAIGVRVFDVIPLPVIVATVIAVVLAYLSKRSVPGRKFEAAGASPLVAVAAGIAPHRYQVAAYAASAGLSGLAGVLFAGTVGFPSINEGTAYLLSSIAVVVLGGTSLLGGKGSLIATAVAALFLTQLEQLLVALGLGAGSQNVVLAVALGSGIALHTFRRRTRRRPSEEEFVDSEDSHLHPSAESPDNQRQAQQ